MAERRYSISQASRLVGVENHVLRYWEDELHLEIPRDRKNQRYYTKLHIEMFQKINELKEKGYQLKAIKHALNQVLHQDGENGAQLTDELLEKDMDAALRGFKEEERLAPLRPVQAETIPAVSMEERMAQFQQIMNLIIGRALEVNNEKLSQDISSLVNEKLSGEMELLLQSSDRKEEERFRQLDEVIRSFQKSGQAEAAAARVPFFKRKPFKRSGKSRNASGHPQRSGGLIP